MAIVTINREKIETSGEKSILETALEAGIYIPHLCHHPQFDSFAEARSVSTVYQGADLKRTGEVGILFEGCNLCIVEIEGRPGFSRACKLRAESGLVIRTDSSGLKKARQKTLAGILKDHPHACLLCSQAEGCDRKICSVHIPEEERCCSKFGNCELQQVAQFIGMEMGLPSYASGHIPVIHEDPLITRDYNLCIGCLRCVEACRDKKGADALGFIVDQDRIVVGSKASSLKESGCCFCGFCIEVCPTGALADSIIDVGERESFLVPCKSDCPAGIDVPAYIRLIREGKYEEAVELICEKAPFPEILGHVCFHACESNCRRGDLDQPVAICALKRAVAERVSDRQYPSPLKTTGKKVAIVGSGPAGLSAAYYLNLLGHSVIVFESMKEPGGMLRSGIPAFRLSREVLDREINFVEEAGVEIRTGYPVSSPDTLFEKGFEAIFLAFGAHMGRKLGIPGEEHDEVVDGVSFLREVNSGFTTDPGDRVAIIGGGNVAFDSARSALRLGAKSVTIFYRRTRREIPAYEEEIAAATEEGVELEYRISPVGIEKNNGALDVQFIRMRMGAPDESKRSRPFPVKGSEFKMTFDTVITAIGQRSEIPEGFDNVFDRNGNLNPVPGKGIYLGGDLLTGPRTVIDAVASGRDNAILIDRYLGGEGNLDHLFEKKQAVSPENASPKVNTGKARVSIPVLSPEERCGNFSAVCHSMTQEEALDEAGRCLGCDLRFLIKSPCLPPEQWFVLEDDQIEILPDREGVYVLYDDKKEVYHIAGVESLREALKTELEKGVSASYFSYEEDEMFTSRERQLIQQYMKQHGKMPPGGDEMDELF